MYKNVVHYILCDILSDNNWGTSLIKTENCWLEFRNACFHI